MKYLKSFDILIFVLLLFLQGGVCMAKQQDPTALAAKIKTIQRELNAATGGDLVVDGKMGPKTRAALRTYFAPLMRRAIVAAEGNSKNYGVKVGESSDPNENYRTMSRSVNNTLDRFMDGQPNLNRPSYEDVPFVDYMQKTWAPIGAKNDPDNLNPNWAPNVRDSLRKQLSPEEYERLRRMRLVQLQNQMVVA